MKLFKDFAPGENCKQAEIQLESIIENCSQNYKYTFVDFFHYYGKEPKTFIKETTKTVWHSLFSLKNIFK